MTENNPDPLVCPLCGQPNACPNLGTADISRSCWCNDPALSFPTELLEQLPAEAKGKACICRACVLAFHRQ